MPYIYLLNNKLLSMWQKICFMVQYYLIYCSTWSNIKSIKNAIKSGFIPAWLEMTVKPIEIFTNIIK